jgi:hypothetical protein
MAANYGVLAEVVATSGSLMAATGAIGLAWRGKAVPNWNPADEEVPDGAQKVAGVLSAAVIAYLWAALRSPAKSSTLDLLLIIFGVLTVVSLLGYSFVKGTQTLHATKVKPDGKTEQVDIIGGFKLRPKALELRDNEDKTVQEILQGALYDPDKVWTRTSRQLAKTAVLIGYMGLLIFGTLLLAAAALRIGAALLTSNYRGGQCLGVLVS